MSKKGVVTVVEIMTITKFFFGLSGREVRGGEKRKNGIEGREGGTLY